MINKTIMIAAVLLGCALIYSKYFTASKMDYEAMQRSELQVLHEEMNAYANSHGDHLPSQLADIVDRITHADKVLFFDLPEQNIHSPWRYFGANHSRAQLSKDFIVISSQPYHSHNATRIMSIRMDGEVIISEKLME